MANNRSGVKLPAGVAHKIFMFAAPLQYVPVSRLHQRYIPGPQYYVNRLGVHHDIQIQPTDVQCLVLQTVKDLVGMGRVNTWTDQPQCPARKDHELDEIVRDDPCVFDTPSCTLHPFYFNFPAQNCVLPEVV